MLCSHFAPEHARFSSGVDCFVSINMLSEKSKECCVSCFDLHCQVKVAAWAAHQHEAGEDGRGFAEPLRTVLVCGAFAGSCTTQLHPGSRRSILCLSLTLCPRVSISQSKCSRPHLGWFTATPACGKHTTETTSNLPNRKEFFHAVFPHARWFCNATSLNAQAINI